MTTTGVTRFNLNTTARGQHPRCDSCIAARQGAGSQGSSQPVGTGRRPGGVEEERGEEWVSVEVSSMSERLYGARGGDRRSGAQGSARVDLTGAGAALSEIRVAGGWKGRRMTRGSCTAMGRMMGGREVCWGDRGGAGLAEAVRLWGRGRKSVGWSRRRTGSGRQQADRPVVLGIQPKRPGWETASKSREQTHTAVWVIWPCIAQRCGRVSGLSLR